MIPNILTTLRLAIIPVFAYSVLNMQSVWLSVALFLFSGVTDIVDGFIARRFNMITNIGKIYDPFVDKLMQMTAVLCLAVRGIVPLWLICVVLGRELAMIVTGVVLYVKKTVVHSNWYGKAATVLFYAVMLVLILFPNIDDAAKTALLIVLVATMLLAAAGYFVKFVKKSNV